MKVTENLELPCLEETILKMTCLKVSRCLMMVYLDVIELRVTILYVRGLKIQANV